MQSCRPPLFERGLCITPRMALSGLGQSPSMSSQEAWPEP